MEYSACVFSLIVFVGILVVSSCVTPEQTEACDAVFSPNAMKRSCCSPMQEFVNIIANCKKKSKSKEITCAVAKCVTEKYGVVTHGKIDEAKVKAVIRELNEKYPDTKKLNADLEKNCLEKKYKKYVTVDPKCDVMKFQSCAFIGYLFGCQNFTSKSRYCKKLTSNVATCKPVLNHYLKQINSKPCN